MLKIVGLTTFVVFVAGALLPGLQRSGHPRPAIQAILSVLFFLERPAKSWGLGDQDVGMLALRMSTTLICGFLLGCILACVTIPLKRKHGKDTT